MLVTFGAVAFLGGLGSVARYVLGFWSGSLPWGILLSNSLASFIAGLAISNQLFEIAVIFGVAGGLSTFSTFAAQTYDLWTAGVRVKAIANLVLNLVVPALSLLTAVILL